MDKILLIALGGAAGSVLRYGVTLLANEHGGTSYPYGTVLVNLIGSFFFGLLFVYFGSHAEIEPRYKLLLTTGLLGGFTTFSTYTMELFSFLILHEEIGAGLSYLLLNVLGGFLLCWLGFAAGNAFF